MKNWLFLVFLIFAACSPLSLWADDTLPDLDAKSTLDNYLEYAALNNPGLKAEFLRWKAALEKIPQVKAWPDPRFTYTYLIREVETRVGPQRHKLSLTQTFPWFGKLDARSNLATAAANIQRQKYDAAKLNLFFDVKIAYYDLYYLGREIKIMQENIDLLTDFEKIARTKYTTGSVPYSTVSKAQVELSKLTDRRRSLEDWQQPLSAKMNKALNRPASTFVVLPDAIWVEDPVYSDSEYIDRLAAKNPVLLADQARLAKEKAALDLAGKQGWPDITLGVEYVETGAANMPGQPGDGKDPLGLMFSLNIPFWRGQYNAAQAEARLNFQAAQQTLDARQNELITDLQTALYTYREALRKIELYRESLIPKAYQSLKVSQQAFSVGEIDFLELIDAQRTLSEFKLAYEKALTDKAKAVAKIELLVGE